MMENHTVRRATHTLTFWKNGVACGALDNADKVELKVNGNWPSFKFDSAQDHNCVKLETALEEAFKNGQQHMAASIRSLIGAADSK